ncbi:MAG: hypothetical protein ICV77_15765, partial [Cyanobacteria bacterium Co-bin8]|nr:hypothetical protein [Cyanobacteria bacterium Co-bin8]
MSLSSPPDNIMTPLKGSLLRGWFDLTSRQVQVLAAAIGLVVLPVFFQAPL